MKYKYIKPITTENGAAIRIKAEDYNEETCPSTKFSETTYSDWWINGLSTESRALYVNTAVERGMVNGGVFVCDGEVLSLTDGEPVEVGATPVSSEETTPVEEATEIETVSAEPTEVASEAAPVEETVETATESAEAAEGEQVA